MHKFGVLSVLVAAIMVLVPLSASATTPTFTASAAATAPGVAAPRALAHCPNGLMYANYSANIYSGWNSTRVIGHVSAGSYVYCVEGYDLGRRYTACGVTNGNGWVRLVRSDGVRGWAAQGCFSDV